MTIFISILQALIALPKIGDQINAWIAQISAWYISNQDEKTSAKIMDAAAFAMRAKSKEDRIAAAQKWQDALSRPRYP